MKKISVIIRCIFFLLVFGNVAGVDQALGQELERTHTVVALDNFYSLSLKYDVSVEELKQANPGIVNPKPGDILIIPAKGNTEEVRTNGGCEKSAKNRETTYRIALLIPFYLEQVSDSSWMKMTGSDLTGNLMPFRFVQYYHGFMMAADSLRKQGLKLEISVYDVDQQESKVSAVLQKPEMKKMDLIIGPFFKNSFTIASDFAKSNKIPIVNPLSSRPDIIEDNPFVCKPVPSVESQPGIVAKLVERDYKDHKILLYVANQFQNSEMILKLKEAIETADPAGTRKVTIVDYSSDSIQGFKKYAAYGKSNLVIIYADNEVLPAALLSKLTVVKQDYNITVLGLPEWEKFTNLETIYLIALNAHFLTSSYIDPDDAHTKAFIRTYRERYFDEPMSLAFIGFDAGYFFLKALSDYDGNLLKCLPECHFPLTQNQFYFQKTNHGGYDNLNWNVLQYYDYYLVKKSLY